MSNKMIINLRAGMGSSDFKKNDILVYDATEKDFYLVTPETFFDEYEKKLNKLLEKYNQQFDDERNERLSFQDNINLLIKEYKKNFSNLLYDYEKGLNDLISEYQKEINENVSNCNQNIESIKNDVEVLKNEFKNFTIKIQESNFKLIEMVENFIKGEKN